MGYDSAHLDGSMQERRKSSVLAMELLLSCTYPSICNSYVIECLRIYYPYTNSHNGFANISFNQVKSYMLCDEGVILMASQLPSLSAWQKL